MQGYQLDPGGTLPRVVARQARSHPDRVFVQEIIADRRMTYGEVDDTGRRWAQVFADRGVQPGDRVGTMLLGGVDALCVWIGCGFAGAIDTGVNTAFRGRTLHYALDFAGVEVLVVHASALAQVMEVLPELPKLRSVLVIGDAEVELASGVERVEPALAAAVPVEAAGPEPWDTSALIYTSGTTGPPKGVLVPWGQFFAYASVFFGIEHLDHTDVFFSNLPWYHTGGRFGSYMMALVGGTVVFKERFQLSTWIDEVERFGVTSMILLPLMQKTIVEGTDDERRRLSSLRFVHGRFGPDHVAVLEQMQLRVSNSYSMTESPPVVGTAGGVPPTSQAIGRARRGFPGYEVRLVDEHDLPVPDGVVGELIVRSATPWTMNAGYFANPEATARAWRNGRFHTGDMMRVDECGNFVFVDRSTDSIRRSGENISSWDVESYLRQHPDVQECAAIAAPNDTGRGQDVKVVLTLVPGSTLTQRALHEFLAERMPRFMVPRYIELVDDFPRTPTTKIRKVELRADALNPRTWDAETGTMLGESV